MGINRESVIWIEIDGQKLKDEIRKAGTNPSRVARELGCGHAITNAISRNKIQKPLIMLICREYGINLERITFSAKTEPAPAKENEIVIVPEISSAQWISLKEVIKAAILEAAEEIREAKQ